MDSCSALPAAGLAVLGRVVRLAEVEYLGDAQRDLGRVHRTGEEAGAGAPGVCARSAVPSEGPRRTDGHVSERVDALIVADGERAVGEEAVWCVLRLSADAMCFDTDLWVGNVVRARAIGRLALLVGARRVVLADIRMCAKT